MKLQSASRRRGVISRISEGLFSRYNEMKSDAVVIRIQQEQGKLRVLPIQFQAQPGYE